MPRRRHRRNQPRRAQAAASEISWGRFLDAECRDRLARPYLPLSQCLRLVGNHFPVRVVKRRFPFRAPNDRFPFRVSNRFLFRLTQVSSRFPAR